MIERSFLIRSFSELLIGVFAMTERSEMGLYDVSMFMSLFDFRIGMMFASFHALGMMLLFSDMVYMLVRYACHYLPSSPGVPHAESQ